MDVKKIKKTNNHAPTKIDQLPPALGLSSLAQAIEMEKAIAVANVWTVMKMIWKALDRNCGVK